MPTLTYPKGSDATLSDNFKRREFDCPCYNCASTTIDMDLISKLEAFREALGSPIRINSGYRCAAHQAELRARGFETASGRSTHEDGRAADVEQLNPGSRGIVLEAAARQVGFRAVGVAATWIHVDLRADKDRRWTYGK